MLDRSIKPKSSGIVNFTLPNINNFTSNNLLTTYFIKKTTLPIVQIKLLIPSGSIFNPNSQEGLSSLTSMLLDENAGKLNGFEISNELELLGSVLNISPNKEYTVISLLTLKENINKSLDLLSTIIQLPNFVESDYEREKQKLLTQIIQLNDDSSYIASSTLNNEIYKDTPYEFPIYGMNESVTSLTNDDVKEFYNRHYNPDKSFLVVVGDLTENEVNSFSTKYFNKWNNSTNNEIGNFLIKPSKRIIKLIDKPDSQQTELRIGQFSKDRNSKDFYDRTILNLILGGQFTSRINLNLRENKGYTYGAHSNYNYNKNGSTFVISTSVKSENTCDSISEIFKELKNIKETIKQEEVDFSKTSLIRRYPSLFETYSQVASNLALIPSFNLNNNYFKDYFKNIENVSLSSVKEAANTNIDLDSFTTIVVGNKKELLNDLKSISDNLETELEVIDYNNSVG